MRPRLTLTLAATLILGGCIEGHRSPLLDDPKYSAGGDSSYGKYLAAREAALTGKGPAPAVIPRALPTKAPTPAEISGPTALEIFEREAAIASARTIAAATGRPARVQTSPSVPDVVAVPRGMRPAASGGYVGPGVVRSTEPLPKLPADDPSLITPAAPPLAPGTFDGSGAREAQTTDALTRYAATQRQRPGTTLWQRPGGNVAQAARGCARYPNPAAAQLMFLSSGGPQSDPMGLDPDGDGFVCGWDPAPYRAAAK